jgi:hypothetical protein
MWSCSANKPESGYFSLGYTLWLYGFPEMKKARNSCFLGRNGPNRHSSAPISKHRYDFLRLLINVFQNGSVLQV